MTHVRTSNSFNWFNVGNKSNLKWYLLKFHTCLHRWKEDSMLNKRQRNDQYLIDRCYLFSIWEFSTHARPLRWQIDEIQRCALRWISVIIFTNSWNIFKDFYQRSQQWLLKQTSQFSKNLTAKKVLRAVKFLNFLLFHSWIRFHHRKEKF
jgi:hypothetical protein